MSLARKIRTTMGIAVMASMLGWQAAAAPITFTDDFERADGPLGPNWNTVNPSHWAISGGAVTNQLTDALPATAGGNIALPVKIAGNFSVSIDSINSATTRRSEAVEFHIQEDGTRYHARYQRSNGAIQIGAFSPSSELGAVPLVYAGSPGPVTASATDIIRLTVTGDNTETGIYTVKVENLTQNTSGSANFTLGAGALTGGLMGFSSSHSGAGGTLKILSFTATGEAVPEPMSSALFVGGAAAAGLVRPRR